MYKLSRHRWFIFLLTLNSATFVSATQEQEQAALWQVLNEIEFLHTVVNRAANKQDERARYQFDYPALRRDLRLIKTGITEHLNRVQREPRKLPAIAGDYH